LIFQYRKPAALIENVQKLKKEPGQRRLRKKCGKIIPDVSEVACAAGGQKYAALTETRMQDHCTMMDGNSLLWEWSFPFIQVESLMFKKGFSLLEGRSCSVFLT
jgi:hypothetical protein